MVPLTPQTLNRLEHLAKALSDQGNVSVAPLQIAALLLERATESVDEHAIEALTHTKVS